MVANTTGIAFRDGSCTYIDQLPYIGNSRRKKTFAKFVNLEAIANVFSHFFSPGIPQLKMVNPRVIGTKILPD